MNATEEWLRYIESKAIMQRYGITGYSSIDSTDDEESEENTKDQESV